MIRVISFIFFLFPIILSGQTPTVVAAFSKSRVAVNEPFNLTITIQNTTEDDELKNPDFGELRLIGGPQLSTEYYNFNGKESGTASYTFNLIAKSEKTFDLGPFSVIHRGKKYNSNKISIKAKGSFSPSQNQQPQQIQPQQNTANDGDYFITLESDKKSYYLGEQVIVNLKLFHRVDLNVPGIEHIETPAFAKVFRVEDFSKEPVLVTIKGKKYVSRTIESFGLFTHNSGKFTIPAIIANFSKVDPWSFNGSQVIQKSTYALVFDVKPLPLPQPTLFTGAIGKYEANFNIEKEKIEVGKSFLVTINLQGNGDESMAIAQPWLNKDLWESFGPNEVSNQSFEEQNRKMHSKVIEYQIIPSIDTILQIAPSFIYFDTETGTYQDAIKTKKQVTFTPSTIAKVNTIDNLPTDLNQKSKTNWQGGLLGLLAGLSVYGFWAWLKRRRKNKVSPITISTPVIDPPVEIPNEAKDVIEPIMDEDMSAYMPKVLRDIPVQDIQPIFKHKAVDPIQNVYENESTNASYESEDTEAAITFDVLLNLWQQKLSSRLDLPYHELDRATIMAALATERTDEHVINGYLAIQNKLDAAKYAGAPLGDPKKMIEKIKRWGDYTG